MKFWILLAAVVGFHVQDLWDYLLIWVKFRPEYPFTILVYATCPGWLFFRSHLLSGLVSALVYAVIAYAIGLGAKRYQLRNSAV